MTNTPNRPTCTPDSLAAFMIAETHLYASLNPNDFHDTLHAFDDADDTLTDHDRMIRFIDINLDETTDNDTLMHFDDPDNIDIHTIINDDRLAAMLYTSYTELRDSLPRRD